MAVKLVVFDMDDTLYLERDYVKSGFNAVGDFLLTEHELEGFADAAWAEFLLGRRGDVFNAALRSVLGDTSRVSVQRCVEVYRSHKPQLRMSTGTSEFVNGCAERFRTALVTDGPATSQRAKVVALELESRLERIVVTDELGDGWAKPAPRSFELLQEEFDHRAGECVYLGDNPHKDFIGPHLLGWKTVRVRRKGGLYESAIAEFDASVVVSDLNRKSLQACLASWGDLE